MAEFHKAIQSEFPEIHLKDLQTQYLSRIYTNSVFKDHSRVTIVTAGFLMVLTTIALCGLPIINEFCNPTPPICITIFFTQTKNV